MGHGALTRETRIALTLPYHCKGGVRCGECNAGRSRRARAHGVPSARRPFQRL